MWEKISSSNFCVIFMTYFQLNNPFQANPSYIYRNKGIVTGN